MDGKNSEDSTDEEYDFCDEADFKKLDIENNSTLPYDTVKLGEDIQGLGFVEPTEVQTYEEALEKDRKAKSTNLSQAFLDLNIENRPTLPYHQASKIVKPLLDKLVKSGFEKNPPRIISDTASVSLLLNRPLSLSTRENDLLRNELLAKTDESNNCA